MAALFPKKRRPGEGGFQSLYGGPLETPQAAESWLAESPGRRAAIETRTRIGADVAGRGPVADRPFHEFMEPGAERTAAAAKGRNTLLGGMAAAGERAGARANPRSVLGGDVGEIQFGVTQKKGEKGPTKEEMDQRYAAYKVRGALRDQATLLGYLNARGGKRRRR